MRFKGLMSLWLALFLLLSAGAGASVAVNFGSAVLFSDDGTVLIEAGIYSGIVALGETGFFAASKGSGGFCIIDENGNELTDSIYTDAITGEDRLILCTGGKYGACDFELNTVVPFEYSYLTFGNNGRYLALKGDVWDDIADTVFIVYENGECMVTDTRINNPVYALNDIYTACLSGKNGRWGYIDANADWYFDPMLLSGGKLIDGMAAATLASGTGVINTNANWLVTPFCNAVLLNEYIIVTLKGEICDVYTRDSEGCRKVFTVKGEAITAAGRYAGICTENGLLIYNTETGMSETVSGASTISEGWDGELIVSCAEGMRLKNTNTVLYPYINRLISGKYCAYSESGERYAVGVMEADGSFSIECKYNRISSPADGYIAAEDETRIYLYKISQNVPVLIGSTET